MIPVKMNESSWCPRVIFILSLQTWSASGVAATGFGAQIAKAARTGDVRQLARLCPAVCKNKNDAGLALFPAIENHQTAAGRFLIDRGANVNSEADDGSTPLIQAARDGNGDIVEALLKGGRMSGFAAKMEMR
jgi:hypothetical protein